MMGSQSRGPMREDFTWAVHDRQAPKPLSCARGLASSSGNIANCRSHETSASEMSARPLSRRSAATMSANAPAIVAQAVSIASTSVSGAATPVASAPLRTTRSSRQPTAHIRFIRKWPEILGPKYVRDGGVSLVRGSVPRLTEPPTPDPGGNIFMISWGLVPVPKGRTW